MVLDREKKPKKEKKHPFLTYALVPFVLSVPPIVGWAIGSFLDDYFHTQPYLMYVFLVLGLIAGYREFFRIIKNTGE